MEVEQMDDHKIVGLFLERNELALKEVSQKYGAYCLKVAQNILGNYEDAEECVNDTYMRAWNSMPPNKPTSLGVFLGRITKNLALDIRRSFRCEKRGGNMETISFDELEDFLSENNSVESESELNEMLDAINTFLRSLPAKKRLIFVARYWQCDKLSEIAERYGMAESSVASSLSRTCKKLKDYLIRRGFDV